MSTDRELLELAAQAAGILINGLYSDHHPPASLPDGYLVITNASGGHSFWNPLDDDGDALRLAAQLKIDLEWQATSGIPEPMIEAYRREEAEAVFCASNHESDYRRAIVLVAAEIGRAM